VLFEEALAVGKAGESAIARWLTQSRGASVLPVYEVISGNYKGPRFFTPSDTLIAPDMLCFSDRETVWIEAKQKSVFTWHRISREWVTGIDVACYEDYLKIADMYPNPVWLLFLHTSPDSPEHDEPSPTGLFGGEIQSLREQEHHRWEQCGYGDKVQPGYGKRGMVYWGLSALRKLASIDEMEINHE